MRARALRRWATRALAAGAVLLAGACVQQGELSTDTFRLKVSLRLADGSPLPAADAPLCLDLRGANQECPDGYKYLLSVEAISLGPDGASRRDTTYNRYARVSVLPGTLLSIEGDRSDGRNVLLRNGLVEDQVVHVIGAFGPTRILVEDIGYQPGDPTSSKRPPSCADGRDNDGDGRVDFPADPGCAFANDDTEEGGSFAGGVSPTMHYSLPTITQLQGYGAGTPFAQEGVSVETEQSTVVVSRVSSSGFYVVDVDPATRQPKPFGGLFIFNFGLPAGVRVCDRVKLLSGTMDEFFGGTQMNFPSFDVHPWNFADPSKGGDGPCLLPDAYELQPDEVQNDLTMENLEAGLVRVRGARIGAYFGSNDPDKAPFDLSPSFPCQGANKFTFRPGASNCDLDRSGKISFEPGSDEGTCACFCYQDPECVEWSSFAGRGTFRLVLGSSPKQTTQADTGAVPTFRPDQHAGQVIKSLTGTLSNFSGGNLNWTIEPRCLDDLVFCEDGTGDCDQEPVSTQAACVKPRTASDNDAESN